MSSDTRLPRKKKIPTLAQREARLGWLLVTPAVIIVLILVVFPVVWNMLLSLQRVRVRDLQTTNFLSLDVSFDNFDRVIGVRDFWETLRTTLAYAFFGTVLSIVGGMWAALVVKKAFIGRSLVRGLMRVARRAPDPLGLFVAVGLVVTLSVYGFVHAGVASGLLPVTGLPLPFVSYGGTSMIVNGAMVGILLNISRQVT